MEQKEEDPKHRFYNNENMTSKLQPLIIEIHLSK